MGLLDSLDMLRKRPGPGMDIGLDQLMGMKPAEPLISQTPPAGFNFSKMDTNAPAPLSALSYPDIAGGKSQPPISGKLGDRLPEGLQMTPPADTPVASPSLPVGSSPSAPSAAPGLLAAKSSPLPPPSNLGALANPPTPPPRPDTIMPREAQLPPPRPDTFLPQQAQLPPIRPPELDGGMLSASTEMPSMASSMASVAPSAGAGAASATGGLGGIGDIFGGILGIAKGIQGKPGPQAPPPKAPQVAAPAGYRVEAQRAPQMQQMGKQIMSGLLADDVQSLLRRRANA